MDMTKTVNDDAATVVLSGSGTFPDYKVFQDLIDGLSQDKVKQVTVNLTQLEFVDSSALGMFLLLKEKCDEKSIKLTMTSPQGQVKKMLEVARLHTVLNIAN